MYLVGGVPTLMVPYHSWLLSSVSASFPVSRLLLLLDLAASGCFEPVFLSYVAMPRLILAVDEARCARRLAALTEPSARVRLERLLRPILARGTWETGEAAAKMGRTAKMVARVKCIVAEAGEEGDYGTGVPDGRTCEG